MPIVSISINLSLAQNLNLLAGNFLLMKVTGLYYSTPILRTILKKKGITR